MNSSDPNNCSSKAAFTCADSEVPILKIVGFGFMSLVILGSVLGNLLVMVSVLKFPRLRNNVTNAFVFSLSCADLLVGAFVQPFYALNYLYCNCWHYGEIPCHIFLGNDVLFCTASIVHLCCISLDRYIAILYPFRYERSMTRRRVIQMLVFCWTYAALISHLPVQTKLYISDNSNQKFQTDLYYCAFEVNMFYAIFSSSMSFYIPGILMTLAYWRIFREARTQERKMIHQQRLVLATCGGGGGGASASDASPALHNGQHSMTDTSQQRRHIRREHKAAKTLAIIMGCFYVCWLPFFTVYVMQNVFNVSVNSTLVDLLFWIGYFNSCINFFIYACYNREFRTAFTTLLCGLWQTPRPNSSCAEQLNPPAAGQDGHFMNREKRQRRRQAPESPLM